MKKIVFLMIIIACALGTSLLALKRETRIVYQGFAKVTTAGGQCPGTNGACIVKFVYQEP